MLLLQIFVLAFSVKLILLFKTLVFGLFARGAELQEAAVVTVSVALVLVLVTTIVPVLVLPVTESTDDVVTVAGAKDVAAEVVTVAAATEGIDGGWLGNGYWRPDLTEGFGLLYGWGLFIGDPDVLQLPIRCKLGAGGV